MDTLSKFLSLHPVTTRLDWRCELGAPWRLINDGTAYGIAPYHLVVHGHAWLEMEGRKSMQLQQGDILMLPHGTPHTLHCGDRQAPLAQVLPPIATLRGTLKSEADGQDAEILCGEFMFDPIASKLLIDALPEVLLLRTDNQKMHGYLYQLLQMLNQETRAGLPGAFAIAQHLASTLFALLIRGWIADRQFSGHVLHLLTEPRLQPALRNLLDRPEEAHAIEHFAAMCHMSRATFIRLFKQTTGHTPASLLTTLRLIQAMNLLRTPGMSIAGVAEKVGYASEPAFHRAFKQSTGMTPGEYRRKRSSNAG